MRLPWRKATPKQCRHRPEFSDYLNPCFLTLIDADRIRTILELGCKDGKDTLELRRTFGATVHAFECNPDMIPKAEEQLAGIPGVQLVKKAVWDANGTIPFFPVVLTVQNGRTVSNLGASSCFRARPDYCQRYFQRETSVESIRLDTYCSDEQISRVDLICMDVQGAALHALTGLGDYIDDVRYIVAEIERRPIYYGQDLYTEIHTFMERKGFRQMVEVSRDAWFSDFLYVR